MKRNLYIRLVIMVVAASLSLILFAYTHTRSSQPEDCNGESGKCGARKNHTEYILWESITRNLLIIKL